MAIPAAEVVVLGILQGLTEFLPVSSDGHLALAEILFGTSHAGFALNVVLHMGTLLAVLLVLRRRVGHTLAEGARGLRHPSRLPRTPGGRDALVVLLATIPTALMGLGLRELVKHWTGSPLVVGLGFLLTAVVVASTRWATSGEEEWPTLLGALLIGVAQGVAVLPGVSRSGCTIAMALWLGVRPARAFELAMLSSLPVVAGAILVELPALPGTSLDLPRALLGVVVACVVGSGAVLWLRRSLVDGYFAWFALWVLPLSIATLALARAWPGG